MLREIAAALSATTGDDGASSRTGGTVGCVAADDSVAWALAERLPPMRRLDIRVPGVAACPP